MANCPARGAGRWTRQRKSCSRSSCVGTPKLVTTTPRGLSAPDMCFTAPSFPAASRPCRTSNTECVRAPHIQACSSKSSSSIFSRRSRASCLVTFGGGSSEISASLTVAGSSNRWNCIAAAYPGHDEASSRGTSLVCPEDRRCRAPHVLLGRAPVAHGNPHQRTPAPDGTGEPAGAVALDPFDHVLGPPVALPARGAGAFEANQRLVEHHFVDHLHAGSLREKLREQARRPWAATSQPARASTCWRAAARQVVLAIWPPVTIPIPVPEDSPNSSVNQPITVSSTTAAAGESTNRPAFWSHALVSQSAPTAAGRLPPITKPKNRGPAVPTNPGSARFASSSITRPAGSPCSGSGPPRATRIASAPAAAPTGRALTPSRNRTAAACAAARAVRSMLHPNRSGALRA